ncbi:MAG: DUF4097 family beta strand repeat-containing protein [Nannocystaceae bacterium]|nr:DUF4097 domain-containing protein [bacterium]
MKRLLLVIAASSAPGCIHVGTNLGREPVDASYVFPRDDARSVEVRLESDGDVTVESGSCSLVQARARYDARRMEPSTAFEMGPGGEALVRVAMHGRKPLRHGSDLGVCVSTELPLRLVASVAQGDVDLDLSGVQLRGFDTDLGTGDLSLDFGDASIAQAGIDVDAGTGDILVDAKRSHWTGESTLDIDVGTGDVTVYLPRKVGLRVTIDSGVGDLAVRGLERRGDAYVNALATSSEDQLSVDIDAGLGDITVIAG